MFEKLFIGGLTVVAASGLVLGLSLIYSWPLLWLWNWLMPSLFGLHQITFWQAFGLSALSGLLFRSNSK